MRLKTSNSLQWLEFDLLSDIPNFTHAIFLRHSGTSQEPFKSLNLGFSVGDSPKNVASNLQLVQQTLSLPSLSWTKQCHGKHIELLTPSKKQASKPCDALITHTPDITTIIQHADCQAAIFYDPINHAMANVHSGWRGNCHNIYSQTIKSMKRCFQSRPENLLVGISPSLGPHSAQFIHYKKELPKPFWEYQERPEYFNFWEISHMQLLHAGVLPQHIEIARICTFENPQDFFSYRREKVTGRHGCFACLHKP